MVDTGSTDASTDIARAHGAVLDHRPWDGDFGAARNRALDLARGEWVLYIDADEHVVDLDVAAARAELRAATDAVSLLVRFRYRPGFSPYREYRLWRHHDDIRFVGRIHETMVPDIRRRAEQDGLVIRHSDQVSICHHGYEGDQHAKHDRNLPLLERRVVEHPERCYLWNHLAEIRAALGDDEGARAAWVTGLDLIRSRGLVDRTDVLCYGGLGIFLVSRGVDVTDLVSEALTVAPWYHTTHWVAARNHLRHARPAAAVPHLRHLLAVGSDLEDPTLAYNLAMFTTWPRRALGEALFTAGDLPGALAAYEDAAAAEPDDLEYRTKVTALRAMLGTR